MLAMLIYTVFWVLLMAVIYRMPSSGMVLKQTEAISDLLFDEEFPGTQYKKNFHEIMTEEELWQVNTAVHWPFTGLSMPFTAFPWSLTDRRGALVVGRRPTHQRSLRRSHPRQTDPAAREQLAARAGPAAAEPSRRATVYRRGPGPGSRRRPGRGDLLPGLGHQPGVDGAVREVAVQLHRGPAERGRGLGLVRHELFRDDVFVPGRLRELQVLRHRRIRGGPAAEPYGLAGRGRLAEGRLYRSADPGGDLHDEPAQQQRVRGEQQLTSP